MTSVRQSPEAYSFYQNPYPFYETVRDLGEIVFWEEYGMPLAVSHAAVDTLLRHRGFGRAPADGRPGIAADHLKDFEALERHSMLERDGPDHARLRRLVVGAFSSSRVAALAPMIADLTHTLLADLPEGPFDFIAAFAEKLPVTVICRFLGVPEDMGPQLLAWSHDMVAMYQARRDRAIEDAANTAAGAFRAYLAEYIAYRRQHPADDLLSALIAAEDRGAWLSLDELLSTAVLLLNAGHEATVHALGNGLFALLRLDLPHDAVTPETAAAVAEEILRFDPPLHIFVRKAHREVTLAGKTFRPGDRIAACLAAANRDPEVWTAPARFDPTRPQKTHLAFGAGPHFCIGAALARLEMHIALPAVHSPALGLRLVEPPVYANRYHFHGLDRLTVERTGG
ncbi:MAG: cytochrome P450 [Paracoccaceae bacterium]|nr:cytochrome P450 [Paracoccaceae bacterium]